MVKLLAKIAGSLQAQEQFLIVSYLLEVFRGEDESLASEVLSNLAKRGLGPVLTDCHLEEILSVVWGEGVDLDMAVVLSVHGSKLTGNQRT